MASDRRFMTIAVVLMFHCTALAQVFDPVAFQGECRGRWHNLVFGRQDSAYLGVAIDTVQKTLRTVLDLDGNVFGGSDPDSVVMNGSYTSNGITASGSGDPYGPISISGTGQVQ